MVGWISFNDITGGGADHQVIYVNSPPTAEISCSETPCETWKSGTTFNPILILNNTSDDPDGLADIEKSEWFIDGASALICPSLNPRCLYTVTLPVESYDATLTVTDFAGATHTSPVLSFTVKQDVVANFECSLDNFTWKLCTSIKPFVGDTIYFRDTSTPSQDGSVIDDWDWSFLPDGTPSSSNSNPASTIFNTLGLKTVTLKVTDNAGRVGIKVITISLSIPFPDWREINAF